MTVQALVLLMVSNISLFIGIIGILIILVGAIRGFHEYLFAHDKDFQQIRLTLGSHLILGLDFLVCKDIIDTLLLDTGDQFWQDLAGLIVVVSIRIVLTHVTQQEISQLHQGQIELETLRKRKKNKKESSTKK